MTPAERRRLLQRSVRERLALAAEALDDLGDEFAGVRKTVASRAAEGVATTAGLIAVSDLAVVRDVLETAWHDAVVLGVDLSADAVGVDIATDPSAPWWHVMEQAADKRIKGIEAETMARVKSYVETGLHEGWSPSKLAGHIRDDPSHAFDQTRALVIARTETAYAYNLGSLAGYRESGRVERVEVMDGEECTWPEGHGDEPYADGMVVTVDEAEDAPLAHPNCVRAFSPVVGGAP